MSDSVRPHRRQLTKLPRPWGSPGKNTGVGCHFLLQCMKVKSESEVSQLRPTLSDPMDCSLPCSSDHGFSRQEYWSGVPSPKRDQAFLKCCPTKIVEALTSLCQQRELVLSRVVPQVTSDSITQDIQHCPS